jgi:hypothetical protein
MPDATAPASGTSGRKYLPDVPLGSGDPGRNGGFGIP